MEFFQTTGIEGYLSDESGLSGEAAEIVLPQSIDDVQYALQSACNRKLTVTFQGSRTGICGGAVPSGGLIINFSRMNKPLDFFYDSASETGTITVEAGYTLEELHTALEKKQIDTNHFSKAALESWNRYQETAAKLWFLPNPSEKTATLGGIVCTRAGGSHRGIYVASEIENITLILPDGKIIMVRHQDTHLGDEYVGDAVEFICSSEGLFGAIAAVTLVLCKKPLEQYGLLGYFSAYSQIPLFIDKLETSLKAIPVSVLTADFFDSSCFAFASDYSQVVGSQEELARYPAFPPHAAVTLWLELGGDDEKSLFAALEAVLAALKESGAMADMALAATEERDFERLGRLRHLLTEAANRTDLGRPTTQKWSGKMPLMADISVPRSEWHKIIRFFNSTLKETGLVYTLCGHYLHDSISLRFPGGNLATRVPVVSAEGILANLLAEAALRQCRCEGDHGIGRIKKSQFKLFNSREREKILVLKAKLDPAGTINPGVLAENG